LTRWQGVRDLQNASQLKALGCEMYKVFHAVLGSVGRLECAPQARTAQAW